MREKTYKQDISVIDGQVSWLRVTIEAEVKCKGREGCKYHIKIHRLGNMKGFAIMELKS